MSVYQPKYHAEDLPRRQDASRAQQNRGPIHADHLPGDGPEYRGAGN